jgi:protocadherin Fat 1/2/3
LFQVFIAVQNENDNTPLTVEPVYYPSIPENSPAGKVVIELKAEDYDLDPTQRLTFRITAGNPGGFFSINPDTGKKTTLPLMPRVYCLKFTNKITLEANIEIIKRFVDTSCKKSRSQWLLSLRHEMSSRAQTLGSWV